MRLERKEITAKIVLKLQEKRKALYNAFNEQNKGVRFFYIDDLLPAAWCKQINDAFPINSEMMLKKVLERTNM